MRLKIEFSIDSCECQAQGLTVETSMVDWFLIGSISRKARFQRENLKNIGVMSQGLYGNEAVKKWAQALTAQWGCVLYCASAFICVELSRRGQMPAGHMGLVLLYSGQLQRGMMDYMRLGCIE